MSLNVVHLVGRVGGEPKIQYLPSGKAVCKMTLAVNRQSRNSDEPDWFNLELWNKTAEVAANYAPKGKLIGVKGSLRFDTWSDRNNSGTTRSTPVILVDRLELLGSKRDNESPTGNGSDGF
ncbi:single-stranded DNA-binding protein [Aliterella atlantica]|uniref:Single-stranded DNA-binding protein n=1 Tax=Aliterella atlantica CENA595 TaxID=1618023 RepID=A0A0D8ZWV4_9CYAN|nr:single-stranded DNA-binding protein [Aliterella atlantica]KJH72882.1 single-stranded DNA-binding protein [Aliterella atlantica CENA595]